MSDRATYSKLESYELTELEGRLRVRLAELRGRL